MTWQDSDSLVALADPQAEAIAEQVRSKLVGRLVEFAIDQEGDQWVLRGFARSVYVKQLAQQEVMQLTDRPILANRIEILL